MRRIKFFSLLTALGLVLTLSSSAVIRADGPTPTSSPTPLPTTTQPVTILVAGFTKTGLAATITDPTPIIQAALKNTKLSKLTVKQVAAFKTSSDAQAAGQKENAALVIWSTPDNDTLVIHYESLLRTKFESQLIATRQGRTSVGLLNIPDSSELPVVGKINPDVLTNVTLYQLYYSVADDLDARKYVLAAGAALQAAPLSDSKINDNLTAEINLYKAVSELQFGNPDTAVDLIQSIISANPRPLIAALARNNAAAISISRRSYDTALKLLQDAQKADDKLVVIFINEGVVYRWQQNSADGFTAFQSALDLDPKNTDALNNRGWLHVLVGEYDDAVTDLTNAITLDPNFVDAYVNRAVAYQSSQRLSQGITDATSAINLAPNFERARLLRAELLTDSGDYVTALDDLNIVLRNDPDYALARDIRGIAYERLEQNDKAIADFTAAINLDPTSPYAYLHRSFVYLKQHSFTEVIYDATQAIELNKNQIPEIGDAFWYRAEAYAGLGRYSDALKDYQRYITFAPNGRYVDAARTRITSLKALTTNTPSPTPTASNTPRPTNTPQPTKTKVGPTNTPTSTRTPRPTVTPLPSRTPIPTKTATPIPTDTPMPSDTPEPSNTPQPTVEPTDTATPREIMPSDTPIPTATSTATPVQ